MKSLPVAEISGKQMGLSSCRSYAVSPKMELRVLQMDAVLIVFTSVHAIFSSRLYDNGITRWMAIIEPHAITIHSLTRDKKKSILTRWVSTQSEIRYKKSRKRKNHCHPNFGTFSANEILFRKITQTSKLYIVAVTKF